MDALLSMPMPMASALMVLAAIAAFLFIKVLVLFVTPAYGKRFVRVSSRAAAGQGHGSHAAR